MPKVKDLRSPISAALERLAPTLKPETVAALRSQLEWVDHADLTVRKNALLHVLGALKAEGLDLDFIDQAPAPRPALVLQAAVPQIAPYQPPEPEPPTKQKAPKPKSLIRRRKNEQGETETRLLSIAPVSGPLAQPINKLPFRVNPRLMGLLKKKGVTRVGDILFLLPRMYEDRRQLSKIAQLIAGERGTFIGEVKRAEEVRTRGGRKTFRAVLGDSTGTLAATYFQTGPWLKARFPLGKRLVVSGELRQGPHGWEMAHPEIEPADDVLDSPIHFNRIVPIYPGFERGEQRALRELAYKVVDKFSAAIEEPLPDGVRTKHELLPLADAVRLLHFPTPELSIDDLNVHQSPAHHRLAFDELFFLQLGLALKRQGIKVQPGIAFEVTDERMQKARALLPFKLTGAQERVVAQLSRDMARPEPMNRLLQGDVGSGKTAVALIASALAIQSGYQVAVMAPTEILAEQHFKNFTRWLEPLGAQVTLLTAGGTSRERLRQREGLATGRYAVAVGTHALIQEGVDFKSLGLAVIDEQHRFGVIQRHALMAKGAKEGPEGAPRTPDVLVMTATPIPRTLAMTLYGDLDVSVIDELPPGRTPIFTKVFVEKARPRAYDTLQKELEAGRQAYVVYPLVEESEKVDLLDATKGATKISETFPKARVGLLHGRLTSEEKDAVMDHFRKHELDILVCTTVVEVGVDVPNASVMLIESAERFGLSQLHQLRGRVGRGAAKSYCYLMAGYARSEEGDVRLKVMEDTGDGFKIAEKDLELRGPGEFLGTRQSGMPELAVANLARDQALLGEAQDEARSIAAHDPELLLPDHQRLFRALEERWEGRLRLARVG
ncbi:MAG: ATP-dependent DNA helicase RecG [Myxococcaceae bacterium]